MSRKWIVCWRNGTEKQMEEVHAARFEVVETQDSRTLEFFNDDDFFVAEFEEWVWVKLAS